jgi:hypothetical protein
MNVRLERRLGKLEATAGIGAHPHVVITLTVEEVDAAQAIEKYRAAHPDVPEYAMFILQAIVDHVPEQRP